VTADQLQANHPQLYRKIEYIYAANIAGAGVIERRAVRPLDGFEMMSGSPFAGD
jgi:hypothetical protein